ncbi:MAG: DUF1836 domain-containing protein [Lachnospira sp.]
MSKNDKFLTELLAKLTKLKYIKPGDVPNINLYMDQVTTFMDEHLSEIKRHEDDKILTKTMINNYTKNNLLPPPDKKKYSKNHLYILAFIYYYKNILPISDIQKLLNPLTEKFFDGEAQIDLDELYNQIYSMEKRQISSLTRDILSKSNIARESFSEIEDDDDKDFLQFFSLICLLSFDIYLKKYVVETLIDDYSKQHAADTDTKGKSSKSKEAKVKEAKAKEAKAKEAKAKEAKIREAREAKDAKSREAKDNQS